MRKLKDIDGLFAGCHFNREVIVLCVPWYLRCQLIFRDLAEMMAERGLSMAHTTIMRWIQRFTPEFVKRWNRLDMKADQSWRVDEPYAKIRGKWVYPYRAVDRAGKTVDFRLSARRNVAAAKKAFFAKAIRSQGRAPVTVTLDGLCRINAGEVKFEAEENAFGHSMKKTPTPRTTLAPGVANVPKRLHYPREVILLCVRWYVAYSLSLRNLEEMMAERGIEELAG